MSDKKPFVRMSNHDIGGYPECEWHVVICGLPTRITALEYPTTWLWETRVQFLDARACAYAVARSLSDSLCIRLVEEFSPAEASGESLPGVKAEEE